MEESFKTIVAKGEFKAKMFEFLRKIEETGEPILVTDYGRPAIVVYPYLSKSSVDEVFSKFRGKLRVKGDLLASENEEWGELS